MKIENLKDLQKLIQLCQKLGVKSLNIGEVSLSLGDIPVKQAKTPKVATRRIYGPSGAVDVPTDLLPAEQIDTPDSLSDEELLYYSAGQGEQ